jgi:hypothetical protein
VQAGSVSLLSIPNVATFHTAKSPGYNFAANAHRLNLGATRQTVSVTLDFRLIISNASNVRIE